MSEKLNSLPCPACGAYPDLGGSQDGSELWVACGNLRKCRMTGPSRKTVAEAVAAWNALPRALTWADNPPQVPGWYWYKTSSHLGITKFPELCDRTREGWQWAGPIPEPRETKKWIDIKNAEEPCPKN